MPEQNKQDCTREALEKDLATLREDLLADYNRYAEMGYASSTKEDLARQEALSNRIEALADKIMLLSKRVEA